MTYLAIDPGRDTGWAVFADRETLVACGVGAPWDQILGAGRHLRHAAIEKPKIYQARNMKGDPNDIVTLGINVGEYKYWAERVLLVPTVLVTPHEWKGTTPKEVDNARTLAELSTAERAIVKKAAYTIAVSKQHNMLDAIGFGRACFVKRLWR